LHLTILVRTKFERKMNKVTKDHPQMPVNKVGANSRKMLIIGISMVLTACVGPVKKLPQETDISVPEQWQIEPGNKDAPAADSQDVKTVENGWLESFDDAELNKYVQKALDHNPDLLASASRLKQAIEQVTISGAGLWPSAQLSGSKSRTEVTGISGGVGVINGVAVGTGTEGVNTSTTTTVNASLGITWEADIWGKLTNRKRSAAYNAKSQAELFKAARLSLVANVSRAWYNLVTNKLQLDLAHQRLDSFKRTANLIDENYKRGLRSALDVYLSRTDVQVQVSALANARFSYLQSLRAFKALLGEYPDTSLEFEAELPVMTNVVPAGLPAELLTRRPDVRASQLAYKSQVANAKASHKDRFPSISFSGSIGDSRNSIDQLFDNDNLVKSFVYNLAAPVFQAGAFKSREMQAVYQAEASFAALVKTTLTAFQEVEDTLSQETSLRDQHTAIKKAVKFAQGGLDLALDRYQSGIENYTTVLESQRRLYDSMRNEINLRNALVQNRVGIHLALGGDFNSLTDDDSTKIKHLPSAASEK